MKKPWTRVRNKFYIFIPGGEIQIGLKWHNVSIWHRGKLYKVYRSQKAKKFLEG